MPMTSGDDTGYALTRWDEARVAGEALATA